MKLKRTIGCKADAVTYYEFNEFCREKGLTMSKVLRAIIEKMLETGKMKEKVTENGARPDEIVKIRPFPAWASPLYRTNDVQLG